MKLNNWYTVQFTQGRVQLHGETEEGSQGTYIFISGDLKDGEEVLTSEGIILLEKAV